MSRLERIRWLNCYSALAAAVMLLVVSILAWGAVPIVTIGGLILAMVAVMFALWNYNQARFSGGRHG